MAKDLASSMRPAAPGVRQRLKEQRPGQILEAAFAAFAEKGYAATRLEDVAARIGVTKGTIYVYFESKEQLFKAVCRSFLLPVFERIERLPEEFSGSAAAMLRAILELTYHDFVANARAREFIRLMIGEASRVPELVAFYASELIHRGHGAFRAVLARGVETGEFRPDAAALLAESPEFLVAPAVLAALNRNMLGDGSSPPIERQLEAHLELLLGGLRRRG
jgi:AcrR family transcriptional regulator